ncbi:albusnodin family lasso peptide [Jiangella mangrovi]|uniref:Albusnodin family lasso peptide n=1 Tax=Jiangella mangrovi TaxID=1524084 RepID=A0A7W9GUF1_9ACTN|nr:albusnodin family lasso peptide [Jiangella mangrovi]MBB5789876.1 hypothetical protein [Jiangella mangrovi]
MPERPDSQRDDRVLDRSDEITDLGDAVSLTTGGSGSSVEDKRYPYG